MSPDNPTQILTTHDLRQLRTLQQTAATLIDTRPPNGLRQHLAGVQQQQQVTNSLNIISSVGTAATISSHNITRNANNFNNLLAAAAAKTTFNTTNMPATSKYVLLQQNRNGQFTAYDGTTTAITTNNLNGNSNNNDISNVNNGTAASTGNIVLLATEPLETSNTANNEHHHSPYHHHPQQQHHVITTSTVNDNDEELRSLAWLNNSNLIKEIVTTTTPTTSVSNSNTPQKRAIPINNANICIVNASNAHELIEEMPHQVTGEEQIIATNVTTGCATKLPAEAHITALSASDFQQQFKRFSAVDLRDTKSHTIYGNIAALGGATTTVHVGPSGTTTVVEYKAGTSFLPARQLLSNSNSSQTNNITTATNLSNCHSKSNSSHVPSLSSSSASTSTTTVVVATSHNAVSKHVNLPTTTAIVANGNSSNSSSSVVNGNNIATSLLISTGGSSSSTIYQGHKTQQQTNGSSNIIPVSTSNGISISSSSSTTHHPHKKYLREKMNVLDHGGESGSSSSSTISCTNNLTSHSCITSALTTTQSNNSTITVANSVGSTITVVSSPASSNTSLSSSLSTAAINGGNSPPLSKTSYITLSGSSTPIALNYSSSNSSATAPFITVSSTGSQSAASSPTTLTTTGIPPGYTLVSHPALPLITNPSAVTQQQEHHHHQVVVSSPTLMVSHDIQTQPQHTTKEFYTLNSTTQQLQQQQQLHLQQQQHQSIRSPTSFSSYDNDSLKDLEISNSNSNITNQRIINNSTPHQQQQQTPLLPKSSPSSSLTINTNSNSSNNQTIQITPQKQKHTNKVPYDPLVHTHNKPPYSFSSLIFMAIEGSQEKALPVKEIYAWIVQHFPYFKTAPTGWKNSVRHNLSLNKSFVKVEKAPNMGKGSLWRVEQQQRQNLIQALNRSPFFQNSSADKINLKSPGGSSVASSQGCDMVDGSKPANTSSSHINSRFDPNLFPNLSKAFKDISDVVPDVPDDEYPSDYSTSKLTQHNNNTINNNNNNKYNYSSNNSQTLQTNGNSLTTTNNANNTNKANNSTTSIMGAFSNYESIQRLARDCGADSIDDVNAATAMLALKHGPKVFTETFQNGSPVITSSPSEDHTYSAGGGGSAAGSGASTPLNNGSNSSLVTNGNILISPHQGCADNQSNCASSDAAYESSEECHNITPEELENQQRHRDGVDALLSLSLSSGIDTSSTTTNSQNSSLSSNSPIKRPPSTTVEEEHTISTLDRNSSYHHPQQQHNQQQQHQNHISHQPHNMSKMALLSTAAANLSYVAINGNVNRHSTNNNSLLDEGYNTQSYFGSTTSNTNGITHTNGSHHNHHYGAMNNYAFTPQKKPKSLRSLRTKIKRKANWMR